MEYLRIKNGSISGFSSYVQQNTDLFPTFTGDIERLAHIENKYKTMWEIPQKLFMKLAADRSRYIDQSSSTNVYIRDCTDAKLRACHLYANMLGLKTIMYYLRQTGGETVKFTADPAMIQFIKGLNNIESENKKDESKSNTQKKFVCTDTVCTSCT